MRSHRRKEGKVDSLVSRTKGISCAFSTMIHSRKTVALDSQPSINGLTRALQDAILVLMYGKNIIVICGSPIRKKGAMAKRHRVWLQLHRKVL